MEKSAFIFLSEKKGEGNKSTLFKHFWMGLMVGEFLKIVGVLVHFHFPFLLEDSPIALRPLVNQPRKLGYHLVPEIGMENKVKRK